MPPPRPAVVPRLASLDAFRGALILVLVGGGLGMAHLINHPTWGSLAAQLRPSTGDACTFWDLLRPLFLFIVGAALPLAAANRQGQAFPRQLLHAVSRAAALFLLGVFLNAYEWGRFDPGRLRLNGTLQQIALAYLAAFFLKPLGPKILIAVLLFLLAGHTAAHLLHGQAAGTDPWSTKQNVGSRLDGRLGLNSTPDRPAVSTILAALATVLLGVLAGDILLSGLGPGRKAATLAYLGLALLALAWGLAGGGGWVPVSFAAAVPLNPRLGTASFVLFAAGWAFLMLAAFYLLLDVMLVRLWAFPFLVAGTTSLFLYLASHLLRPMVRRSVGLFGGDPAASLPAYQPVLLALGEVLVFWLMGWWLYRRKVQGKG